MEVSEMGYPKIDALFHGKSQSKLDDDWAYPLGNPHMNPPVSPPDHQAFTTVTTAACFCCNRSPAASRNRARPRLCASSAPLKQRSARLAESWKTLSFCSEFAIKKWDHDFPRDIGISPVFTSQIGMTRQINRLRFNWNLGENHGFGRKCKRVQQFFPLILGR